MGRVLQRLCLWVVYKVKHTSGGRINRYKAIVVAKVYAQTYVIDYEETFSPIAKMATVRAVIAVATTKGWYLHQMDVKNAFLYGDFQEEVYIESATWVMRIQVTLGVYVGFVKPCMGLKQAPRAWHDKIAEYLITIGFCMADADHSLYMCK